MDEFKERVKTRFFASIDLVGSTEFKQRLAGKIGGSSAWVSPFISFYRDIVEIVQNQASILAKGRSPIAVEVWKLLGDEILLEAEVAQYEDVGVLLGAVVSAVHEYNKSKSEERLGLKATCWMGYFPFLDREVDASVLLGGTRGKEWDYIGPSIDCGFRLKEHASPDRCVISIDLAYCLLLASGPPPIYLDGKRVLKGVLQGAPYPILWTPILKTQGFYQQMETGFLKEQIETFAAEHQGSSFVLPDHIENIDALPDWASHEVYLVLSEESDEISVLAETDDDAYSEFMAELDPKQQDGGNLK